MHGPQILLITNFSKRQIKSVTVKKEEETYLNMSLQLKYKILAAIYMFILCFVYSIIYINNIYIIAYTWFIYIHFYVVYTNNCINKQTNKGNLI